MPVCITATDRDTLPVCMGKERGTDILVCIHGTRSRTEKGKYQCPSDKDKGKEIPVDY